MSRRCSVRRATCPLIVALCLFVTLASFAHQTTILQTAASRVKSLSVSGLLSVDVNAESNLLTTIDQDTYGDIFLFLSTIYLAGTPLECGCDVALIVLDDENWAKVRSTTTCADGRFFSELDPASYLQYC